MLAGDTDPHSPDAGGYAKLTMHCPRESDATDGDGLCACCLAEGLNKAPLPWTFDDVYTIAVLWTTGVG